MALRGWPARALWAPAWLLAACAVARWLWPLRGIAAVLHACADEARDFHGAHQIAPAADAAAFAAARAVWHRSMYEHQARFEARLGAALLALPAGESSLWLSALSVCLMALLTLLLSVTPLGAGILMPAWLATTLGSRVAARLRALLLGLCAVHCAVEAELGYSAWLVQYHMQRNVKLLKRLQERLVMDGKPLQQYNCHASIFDGRRWGVKLRGYHIDDVFVATAVNRAETLLILGALGSSVLWWRISLARQEQEVARKALSRRLKRQVLSPRTLSLFYIENTSVHRKGV